MLTIRLKRVGKKNKVMYQLVVTQATRAAQKKSLEILAAYNPHTKNFALKSKERLDYWISQHISMSPTAQNLLISQKLLDKLKVKAFTTPKKAATEEAKPIEAPAA
ncbi:MAG TPA: 30S ribosomal protein S16 [Patescibacteria group bacterium]|nr:30S ribosomal protein S16 [Patescibacteria group bacterium]